VAGLRCAIEMFCHMQKDEQIDRGTNKQTYGETDEMSYSNRQ